MSSIIAGIDIGGTTIKCALFTEDLEQIHVSKAMLTQDYAQPQEIVNAIVSAIRDGCSQAAPDATLKGIGMGSPGPLDLESGVVLDTPNIQVLHNFPLRQAISDATGVETILDNDANVFTLGEAMAGAGKGEPIVVGVTLGTGLGWGLVINGEIFHGAHGIAAEYGRSIWQNDDHTWEDDVSIRGILRIFNESGGHAETPLEISRFAENGNPNALESWSRYGKVLGFALSHIVNMIDPHVIVIGGAMVKAWKYFEPAMMETLHGHIFAPAQKGLQVRRSALGDMAPVCGAASLIY